MKKLIIIGGLIALAIAARIAWVKFQAKMQTAQSPPRGLNADTNRAREK